jgi:hypothetical protein
MYLLDIRIKRHHGQPMTRPGIEPGFGLHGNESHNAQKAGADHPLRVGSASLLLPALVNGEWGCMHVLHCPDVTLLSMCMAVIS